MTTEPARACTLTTAEMPQRAAEFRALAPALISAEVRFRSSPETLERVEALVAAESRCCGFLSFEVKQREEIVVRIS